MKLLIGGSPSKIFHLNEFGSKLTSLGVETKIVLDNEIYDGFPSRKLENWFQTQKKFRNLVTEFRPDAVLIDRQRHFGLAAIKNKIPLLVHLRGDFWSEIEWAKETIYKSFPKNIVIKEWEKIGTKCFSNAQMILPICKFLENRTKEFFPDKKISVMYQGINPENWYHSEGMSLKHPCVGLVQSSTIWGKTREMLTLKKVLERMPNVTFYWAGDGPYAEKILSEFTKFDNFKWLGSLKYPEKVRQFLSEIDVYSLVSGIDMSPLTLLEAQLMKKPVVATNVGGIPELMQENITGFLVEKQNEKELYDKISLLLGDNKKSKIMGESAREFVKTNFSWDKIAKDFLASVNLAN